MLDNIRIEKIFPHQFVPQIFLEVSVLLDVRHCPKLQFCATFKLMMQPCQNDKNPNFRSNFWAPEIFSWVLPLLVVRQCSKLSSNAISRKTNKPNLKKWPPPPQFWAPNYLFFAGFNSTDSYILLEASIVCNFKEN